MSDFYKCSCERIEHFVTTNSLLLPHDERCFTALCRAFRIKHSKLGKGEKDIAHT